MEEGGSIFDLSEGEWTFLMLERGSWRYILGGCVWMEINTVDEAE